jgi:hypothetical protein
VLVSLRFGQFNIEGRAEGWLPLHLIQTLLILSQRSFSTWQGRVEGLGLQSGRLNHCVLWRVNVFSAVVQVLVLMSSKFRNIEN